MDRTRLLLLDDAAEVADVVIKNRAFNAPFEPLREESFYTLDGQVEAVKRALTLHQAGTHVPRVILADDGAIVGRITLSDIVRGAFQNAHVGYLVGEEFMGRGIATEAVAEIKGLAFGELGLHRLEAGTLRDNLASQAVLKRNGFEQYGVAPQYLKIAGRWQDHIMWQALAT